MGTNLFNSIQHRNGPNQRPPNSIFATDGHQQLLHKQLMYGLGAAISFIIVLVIFIHYSLRPDVRLVLIIIITKQCRIFILLFTVYRRQFWNGCCSNYDLLNTCGANSLYCANI